MSALPKPRLFTADEYLMLEDQAEYRSQYYCGEIFAMAGANRRHNLIGMNVAASLHSQLRKRPCEVYQNDMRVKVGDDFYTYPDVVVVCGEPKIERKGGENLLNPIVLFEILSRSTAQFDRNEKARQYRKIAALQELILISQNEPLIEQCVRQTNDSWLISEISGLDAAALSLSSIECEIRLADIYERISFDETKTK